MKDFLEFLEEQRVVIVELTNESKCLDLTDGCDRCFGVSLNKGAAQQLIRELQELVDKMQG